MKLNVALVIVFCSILFSCRKLIKEIVEEGGERTGKAIAKNIPIDEFKENSIQYLSKSGIKIITNRPYNRTLINKEAKKIFHQKHLEALERGKQLNLNKAVHTDGYTGKILLGGDSYHYDHIRSAESIHTKYKHLLTDEEIAKVVNCRENITPTSSRFNQSKGKRDIERILDDEKKVNEFGIDKKLALEKIKKADEAIKNKVEELIRLREK